MCLLRLLHLCLLRLKLRSLRSLRVRCKDETCTRVDVGCLEQRLPSVRAAARREDRCSEAGEEEVRSLALRDIETGAP